MEGPPSANNFIGYNIMPLDFSQRLPPMEGPVSAYDFMRYNIMSLDFLGGQSFTPDFLMGKASYMIVLNSRKNHI